MTESRIFTPTRRQKRLLVQGRFSESDAGELSDRAIARELGVSQPFVSGLRRRLGLTRGSHSLDVEMSPTERGPSTADIDVLGIQEAQSPETERWLEGHDLCTAYSDDDHGVGQALRDHDPFE